ncbi:MAG TPA: maleylacetoacetate isomerase [Burkholderiales bacterium]|nr:maleylacetoacetate isomerase [Burkholderiales bacterium]
MKLYTFFRSSAAFRVRIALNLKGLAYEAQPVSLPKGDHRKPDYARVNPQALVPMLELDDGTRLNQSLAIIEFLDEKYPQPPLVPKDALGRARVRSLALLIACEIHPLNNLRTLNYLRKDLGLLEEQVHAWYRHWIAEGLAKLEAELAQPPGTGRFCHGDAPTMADCCLVPQIFNAKRYKSDLAPYPIAMSVFEQCMKLEAFDRAQPSKQPDANE